MGYEHIKTEHAGPKNGGGAWMTRTEAKQSARCKRRQTEKAAKGGRSLDDWGDLDQFSYPAETGEPLAAVLRPGNAAAHTAADHFEVLQAALEQLPEADLDREILARADIGGRTHAFTQDCRDAGIRFSVGYEVDERVR
jgi:hypothetical protein